MDESGTHNAKWNKPSMFSLLVDITDFKIIVMIIRGQEQIWNGGIKKDWFIGTG